MVSKRPAVSSNSTLPYSSANKDRRKRFHIAQKQARDTLKRDERFIRKREEDKNPELREERRAKNKPHTIDSKRKWDEAVGEDGDTMLGLAVDLEQLSKRRKAEEKAQVDQNEDNTQDITDFDGFDDETDSHEDSEADSMLDEQDEQDELDGQDDHDEQDDSSRAEDDGQLDGPRQQLREHSLTSSVTSTRLDITPETLISKFPSLFDAPEHPKVLITTSINSTLHDQAQLLTTLFPNSTYVRRSAHRFAHKYSVREISSFAANRGYTTLIILMEDQKKPRGLDVVHLPSGPMFHFSVTNWMEGKKLPGHGNPTDHWPELILHNFRTPLGLLTASLFRTIFPRHPELQGRQVVTLHNQRDFIFVRRHRYVFRNKRVSEKSVTDPEGNAVKGVEDIKAGLQELGPRFTLKLRRVDRGIQRRSGQEWQWRGKTDRVRTKFQL
jgi:ribosome production factor 1